MKILIFHNLNRKIADARLDRLPEFMPLEIVVGTLAFGAIMLTFGMSMFEDTINEKFFTDEDDLDYVSMLTGD